MAEVSEDRSEASAGKALERAKKRFPLLYHPRAIRTDGLSSHPPAIKATPGYKVQRDRFKGLKEHSNNEIGNFFRCKRYFPRFRKLESARKFIAH